jgi:cytochrome c oxidase subunit 3
MKRLEAKSKPKTRLIDKATNEWHPHQLLMYVGMFAFAVLELYVLIAYVITSAPDTIIELPNYYTYATVVLLMSVYPLSKLSISFLKENGRQIVNSLIVVFFSAMIFNLLQIAALYQLTENGYSVFDRSSGFVYVLSIMQTICVFILGMFSAYMSYRVKMKLSNPITSLLYFTNPYQHLRLRMIMQYSIYLQLLWVIVYMFLIIVNS